MLSVTVISELQAQLCARFFSMCFLTGNESVSVLVPHSAEKCARLHIENYYVEQADTIAAAPAQFNDIQLKRPAIKPTFCEA